MLVSPVIAENRTLSNHHYRQNFITLPFAASFWVSFVVVYIKSYLKDDKIMRKKTYWKCFSINKLENWQ